MKNAAVEELQKDTDPEDGNEATYLDETREDTCRVDLGVYCNVSCCKEVYLNAHFVDLSFIDTHKSCVLNVQPFIILIGLYQFFKPYSIILLVLI